MPVEMTVQTGVSRGESNPVERASGEHEARQSVGPPPDQRPSRWHRRNRPERQWLFPRQGRLRETDRGPRHPLHHYPRDPVPGILGGIADARADQNIVRLPPGLFQPIAADDVAPVVAEVAFAAPRNGIVEIADPERAPFNEIVARYLKAVGDPRQVVSDPEGRYFGVRSRSSRSCRWAKRASAASVSTNGSAAHALEPDPASANRRTGAQ